MTPLPFDVLVSILSFLPAVRERRDVGPQTIYSCLSVNSLFRDAARLPLLWKPHYQMRYKYSDVLREQARSEVAGGNWQLMYAQRRRIDHAALKLLDRIVTTRIGLQPLLTDLVRQYMDVWDVLELESTCPIPSEFGGPCSNITDEELPQHTLCRRYWAKSIQNTIARGYGCTIWRRFKPSSDAIPSFELAMSSLSTSFGVSDKEITRLLDGLGRRCRQYLVAKDIIVDITLVDFDLRALCIEVCTFMREEGFMLSHGRDEPNILNKLPHAYLTTHKTTLPIALVHIFVAICTRLGISASPINFPGIVLSYVPAHEEGRPPLIVNPSCFNPQHAVVDDNIPSQANPVTQMIAFHPWLQGVEQLLPCGGDLMLIRACRNIAAAFRSTPNYSVNEQHFHAPTLLLICVVNLTLEDEEEGLRWFLYKMNLRPLDCIFLLDELAPHLRPRRRQLLEHNCASILETEENEQEVQCKRTPNVQYFVGMAVSVYEDFCCTDDNLSTKPSKGFISGWTIGDSKNHTDEGVTPSAQGIQNIMYIAYSTDGREILLTTENIRPTTFTIEDVQKLYRNFEDMPLWFEAVDLPTNAARGVEHRQGRGRLLLSPHYAHRYPEDSDVGAQWVKDGMF